MRRFVLCLAAAALPLLLAPAAFAGAGGGSSGFGGGGGGGGFGGGGGYGGGYGYGGGGGYGGHVSVGAFLAVVVLGVFAVAAFMVWAAFSVARDKRRRAERAKKVRLASAEAAEDDADFAYDAVVANAAELYVACQQAWDARDRDKLEQLVGGDLLVEWTRRLDDFDRKGWHNRVVVHGKPRVEYMGLVNREGEADDRIVVRIQAQQDDYVETKARQVILERGQGTKRVSVTQWWTLAQRHDRWIVVSIESDREGAHHLSDAIVAVPEADDQKLHDEATVELAQADAAPVGTKTAEIADLDFDGDARAQALDLSLADARFAPDVLEVAVRRAVAGWAEAIDGEDAALDAVAAPEVAQQLLYPGDATRTTRLVVRGPQIRAMRIVKLDASQEPARMQVDVDVSGRRYVENRDTAAVLSGSKDTPASFTEHWTLAIDGPKENPWRIVATR
jgi:predicted lipid-binding transport protein (Tim44 family)